MINFNDLREQYEKFTGIKLFDEEGDLEDFYREINQIHKPVCGIWHINPIPLTAVKKPFCGIASVDITVLSHPDVWDADEGTRDKMNEFAAVYNGTSRDIKDNYGTVYSVSYNCQTCGAGSRILDANVGQGEVIELSQQISYIIIESGVSAYDTLLYVDGLQIPFLTLVENKIHTTSNIPSHIGVMQTMSEQEAYGIDFVLPYMRDDVGMLVRDVIDRATGNEAHCVVVDIAGKKSCHIMQFTHASSNVQPPQNVGVNVSMTELQPSAAYYNSMWKKTETSKQITSVYLDEEDTDWFVVFWGDGTSEFCSSKDDEYYHIYTDGVKSHEIIIFKKPKAYYKPIQEGVEYFGKNLYFRLAPSKMASAALDFDEAQTVLMSNNVDVTLEPEKAAQLQITTDIESGKKRIGFLVGLRWYYIDQLDGDEYAIYNGQKFQSVVDIASYIHENAKQFIYTSAWD